MDFTVGIVSRNLATTLNFVEFQERPTFHVFRGIQNGAGHWHILSGSRGATCHV